MIPGEQTLQLGGAQRTAHLAIPSGDGPWPGVVVLHEIWGLNDDIRSIADRFAAEGFLALAPDIQGTGRFCMARALRDMARAKGPAYDAAVDAVSWLSPHTSGTIGVAGFCMGGGFALLLGSLPGVDAIAPCYGPIPVNRHRMHRLCPTVASYGAKDLPFVPQARALDRALKESGIAHDMKVYDGVGHSFMTNGAPTLVRPFLGISHARYSGPEAEDAWKRILSFFRTHLT